MIVTRFFPNGIKWRLKPSKIIPGFPLMLEEIDAYGGILGDYYCDSEQQAISILLSDYPSLNVIPY